MGHSLETLSIKEIKTKISADEVCPSLIWLIPYGIDWTDPELEDLKNAFNGYSNFGNINLLESLKLFSSIFIKEKREGNQDEKTEAKKTFINSADEIHISLERLLKGKRKVIILISSLFPEPGWSLVLDVINTDSITDIFSAINNVLDSNLEEDLRANFSQVVENFEKLKNVKLRKPDYNPRQQKQDAIKKLLIEFENITTVESQAKFINSIVKSHHDQFSEELNENLNFLVNLFYLKNNRNNIINDLDKILELNDEAIKQNYLPRTYGIYLYLKKILDKDTSFLNTFRTGEFLDIYISEKYTSIKSLLKIELNNLLYQIDSQRISFSQWENDKATVIREYMICVNSFIIHAQKVIPYLFIEIEKNLSQYSSLAVLDEAKLVGWKISFSLNVPNHKITARRIAYGLNKDFNAGIDINEIPNNLIFNGDVFSDYLHYIMMNDRFGEKRNSAIKMMSLLNLDELEKINNTFNIDSNVNQISLDYTIEKLGWERPTYFRYQTSLFSFFKKSQGVYILANPHKESYSNLRTCIESFLKDLFFVISSNLNRTKTEIISIIKKAKPDFISPHNFSNATAGALNIAIKTLGPLWNNQFDWDNFFNILESIRDVFNRETAHHNDLIRRDDLVAKELEEKFNTFFLHSESIFHHLPYHFIPTSKYMSYLYNGTAWSHKLDQKKVISILVLDEEIKINFGQEILITNPGGINPVMTNFKIVTEI